jgi:hypothetical protein
VMPFPPAHVENFLHRQDRQENRFTKLDFSEIVVWDALLTDQESATLLANLKAKYCID